MKIAVIGLVLAAWAGAADAQGPRSPDQRQTLVELAYVLGEAHALRVACRGPEDQAWRARMTGVIETEQPDESFKRLLVERFNAGYASRQAEAATCPPGAPAQERAAAARGRALARRLAGR